MQDRCECRAFSRYSSPTPEHYQTAPIGGTNQKAHVISLRKFTALFRLSQIISILEHAHRRNAFFYTYELSISSVSFRCTGIDFHCPASGNQLLGQRKKRGKGDHYRVLVRIEAFYLSKCEWANAWNRARDHGGF